MPAKAGIRKAVWPSYESIRRVDTLPDPRLRGGDDKGADNKKPPANARGFLFLCNRK
jgi:hypothetical protein